MLEKLEKKAIYPILRKMEVGDKEVYPISQVQTVRKAASELGLIEGKRFVANQDRKTLTVSVTRKA